MLLGGLNPELTLADFNLQPLLGAGAQLQDPGPFDHEGRLRLPGFNFLADGNGLRQFLKGNIECRPGQSELVVVCRNQRLLVAQCPADRRAGVGVGAAFMVQRATQPPIAPTSRCHVSLQGAPEPCRSRR